MFSLLRNRALWAIVRRHPVRQVRWTVWRAIRRETMASGTVPLADLLIASGAIEPAWWS